MQNNLPSINLVKNQQVPFFDKFLNWTLTIGRLIVIVTELVAVIAFVYRFSLDERIVNLHTVIKQKQNMVVALKSDESKYRNLQNRIALAADFSTKATNSDQTIMAIANLIPNGIILNNLIINKDKVSLKIDVASVSSLDTLTNSLKNYDKIKSISIDNIENKPSAGLSVDITIMLK
jgi:hypothetical protein